MRTSTGVTTLPLARRPATARSTRGKSASLRKEATLTQDARKAGSRVERVGDSRGLSLLLHAAGDGTGQ